MKKTIVGVQIFVLILFVAKIAAVGEIMQQVGASANPSRTTKQAMTDIPPKAVAPSSSTAGDDLTKAKDLFTSLESKRVELEKKEQFLKSEEQRLIGLKKEILEKIDLLHAQEEKLNVAVDASKTEESKRYKELAKVFESAPAAKAGVMLEQLDVQTAAGITMNMKRDKAGAIWGYLSPQKAVEITREITRIVK